MRLCVLIVAGALFLPAQTAPKPEFEVAAIRPGDGSGIIATRPTITPGRIFWTTQVINLVAYAHGLRMTDVQGHGISEIYTFEAKFDRAATDEQIRLMLQTLLAERFHMQAHKVVAQVDGLALRTGRKGLKIAADEPEKVTADESRVWGTVPLEGVIELNARAVTMQQLAAALATLEAPVWDETGLTGRYSFRFRYARQLLVESDKQADYPVLAAALADNLGLELVKQKGPLVTLVVDHLEPPSAN